jgi:hypothetical protein
MDKIEAENILGKREKWELQNMKKALSFMELFNTPEENQRLQACKILLKNG